MKKRYFPLFIFVFTLSIITKAQVCFTSHVDYVTGTNPSRIATADFNNDGNLDIAVPEQGDQTVSIQLGNGTGAFTTFSTFNIGTAFSGPVFIEAGYINTDAFIDIAYVTSIGEVFVSLNNGSGVFSASASSYGMSNSKSVDIADFNHDNFNDLVVTNSSNGNITLYLGDGTGAFVSATNFICASGPFDVACADVNGDGNLDVISCNYNAGNISVLIGNGAGGFATRVNYTTLSTSPASISANDIDSDGDKDILVSSWNSGDLSVFLNNGSGNFGTVTNYSLGVGNSFGLSVADFNADGKLDAAVATSNLNTVLVLLGNGQGGFESSLTFATDFGPNYVCSGDFNNDTFIDIASSNYYSSTISVLLNRGIFVDVQASATDTIFCGARNITLTGSGATTYSWSPSGVTDAVPFLYPENQVTTYTVTGTTNGCTDTDTLTITSLQKPFLFLNNHEYTFCSDDDSLPVFVQANGNALSYLWDHGLINGNQYLLPEQTYHVVGNSANGCITEDSIKVIINPLPVVVLPSPSVGCEGTDLTLSGANSTGGDIYLWKELISGNQNPAGTTPTSVTTDVNVGGLYQLTLENSVTGCVNYGYTYVIFIQLPVVIANSTSSYVCAGDQISLYGGGALNYTWTGGISNSVPFTVTNAQSYTVTGTDADGCSDTATITVDLAVPQVPEICLVTVDDPGDYNIVYWDKTAYTNVDTFFVYREITNNNYQIVGKVPSDSMSMFIDTVRTQYFPNTGNPRVAPHSYKLAIKDRCGNLGAKGLFHTNMFLQDQLNGNFNWTHYMIEGQATPVPSLTNYVFLRDNDLDGIFETNIGTTTSTLVTDPNYFANQFTADWRIETQWSISCNPSLRLSNQENGIQTQIVKSKSNIKNQRTTGIQDSKNHEARLKVYPNPAKEILNLEFLILNGAQSTITIENMLGQVVFITQTNKSINSINTSNLTTGVYFVKLTSGKSISTQKLIIEH